MELRTEPPLVGAGDVFVRSVAAQRQTLHLFYQASLNAQSGYPELWAQDMRLVLQGDGNNAYYRWFGASNP
jgi:spermidine synthase